jgi:hypothetical protein
MWKNASCILHHNNALLKMFLAKHKIPHVGTSAFTHLTYPPVTFSFPKIKPALK